MASDCLRKIISETIVVLCMVLVSALSEESLENDKLTKSEDICLLAPSSGPCFGYFKMWYYNSTTKKCERFVYGGCEGNRNSFESERECKSKCAVARSKRQTQLKGPCAAELASKSEKLIGAYIPQCDKDGYYMLKQCWGSTGTCWCVDRMGNKISSAEEKPGSRDELDCDHPCKKAYQKALLQTPAVLLRGVPIPIRLQLYFPSCDKEGYYKPKQCHNGRCWCVDRLGKKVPGTETSTQPDKLSCQ